jgi:hypothetical protein
MGCPALPLHQHTVGACSPWPAVQVLSTSSCLCGWCSIVVRVRLYCWMECAGCFTAAFLRCASSGLACCGTSWYSWYLMEHSLFGVVCWWFGGTAVWAAAHHQHQAPVVPGLEHAALCSWKQGARQAPVQHTDVQFNNKPGPGSRHLPWSTTRCQAGQE